MAEHDFVIQVRAPKAMQGRIAKFCESFYKDTGMKLNFSDAVRTLIERGLVADHLGSLRRGRR